MPSSLAARFALIAALGCSACQAGSEVAAEERQADTRPSGPGPSIAPPVPSAAPAAPAALSAPLQPPKARCFEQSIADDFLPRAAAGDVGIDGPPLDRLLAEALASQSDALVVIKNGRVVVERSFGQPVAPIETRSVTKSVAGLAILALIADGAIASLDAPLSTFFPEFAEGAKAAITLRHVLTHSTGLAHGKSDADRLNAQADRSAYARALPLETPPGSVFSYNNEAAQLLSGVIAFAAGEPADEYVRRRIFAPIGVHGDEWTRDRAGNVQTYYGLRLSARDLARIGLLLLNGGRAGERQVLPAELVREVSAPSAVSPSYGLLFWRRANLVQALEPIDALTGRVFRTEEEYFEAVGDLLGVRARDRVATRQRSTRELLREAPGGDIGFYAVGGLGQRLAIYPRAGIVAVRQHRRRADDAQHEARVTWRRFFDHVEALDAVLGRGTR